MNYNKVITINKNTGVCIGLCGKGIIQAIKKQDTIIFTKKYIKWQNKKQRKLL